MKNLLLSIVNGLRFDNGVENGFRAGGVAAQQVRDLLYGFHIIVYDFSGPVDDFVVSDIHLEQVPHQTAYDFPGLKRE